MIYTLNWEILSAAEIIMSLPDAAPVPKEMLYRIYSGNAMRLFESHTVPRLWSVSITTKAEANNGEVHILHMHFKPDQKVSLSGLINYIKHQWLDECDHVLFDMTAIEAKAVARCQIADSNSKNKAKKRNQPMRKVKRLAEDAALNAIADRRAGQSRISVSLEDL